MTESTVIITAIIAFSAGAMAIAMWLWPAVSRVRTERDRLQSTLDCVREDADRMARKIERYRVECRLLTQERDDAVSDSQDLTNKVAQLTADCMEFQRLAHEAQDEANRSSIDRQIELHKHNATKRQLSAAKGQITKLKRRIEDGQRLNEDDVQWIVNSIAELGVLINGQAFFLYKGRSLVYETAESEDSEGGIMMYRPVFKREFGECCHPLNYSDPTKIGTVNLSDSDNWMPLPEPPQ